MTAAMSSAVMAKIAATTDYAEAERTAEMPLTPTASPKGRCWEARRWLDGSKRWRQPCGGPQHPSVTLKPSTARKGPSRPTSAKTAVHFPQKRLPEAMKLGQMSLDLRRAGLTTDGPRC